MQKCACNDEDLFRTSVYDHGHFESTFSKYAFGRGGGGHKKEYAVYARENDDNYGRPLRRSRDCLLLSVCVAVWVSLMVSYALQLLILGSCYAVHIKALSIWRREHLDNLEGTQPVAYIGWPVKIEHVKVGIFKRNRDL